MWPERKKTEMVLLLQILSVTTQISTVNSTHIYAMYWEYSYHHLWPSGVTISLILANRPLTVQWLPWWHLIMAQILISLIKHHLIPWIVIPLAWGLQIRIYLSQVSLLDLALNRTHNADMNFQIPMEKK